MFSLTADAANVLFSLFRYGISLLIVFAGAAWGIIWLYDVFRSLSKAPTDAKFRDIPLWIRFIWLITASYGAYYYIVALIVGGTPPTHPPHDGKYWLSWYGKSVEVTQSVYEQSQAREFVLMALIVLSLYAGYKLPKRGRSPTLSPSD